MTVKSCHLSTKTLNWKKKTEEESTDEITHFLGPFGFSDHLCHVPKVYHIDYSATWAITILHAVVLKGFKRRFMKTPE